MAFRNECIAQSGGSLVLFHSSQTLCPRPRISQYMIHILRSLQIHQWLTLWMETETICCSAPSELSEVPQQDGSVLALVLRSLHLSNYEEETGVPEHCFVLD